MLRAPAGNYISIWAPKKDSNSRYKECSRRSKQVIGLAGLNDTPKVHYRNLVAEVSYNTKVMADENHRYARSLFDLLEKIKYLRLDRDVECGEGLFGDYEFRRNSQRPCYAYPLALSAAELMRVFGKHFRIQSYLVQEFHNPVLYLATGGDIVDLERFGKRIDDPHPRIQGSKGVLENNLHLSAIAPQGPRP